MRNGILVGRDEERALALRSLQRGATVVLGGHAGVGKTALARDLAEGWRASGGTVEWATAAAQTAELPFAAVARLLGPVGELSVESMRARTVELIHGAVAMSHRHPERLVVFDDGHHLDASSALLVQHLALAGAHPMLVTVRNGEPVDPLLVRLWEDEHATRVDLVALSLAETRTVAEALLGAAIDDESAHRLFDACQGNPLLLRELVGDAVDAGRLRLVTDRWQWDGTIGRARRLRDAIEAKLDAAGTTTRRLVLLLSLGQPLRLDVLTTLVPPHHIDEAEDRGLIEVVEDSERATVQLGHPLLGEVLTASVGGSELDDARGDLADALAASDSSEASEVLLEARLRVDSGRVESAQRLVEASTVALRLGAADLGEELAEVAHAQGAGVMALILVAEALLVGGRSDEAVDAFEAIVDDLVDDEQRVRVALHLQHAYINTDHPEHADAAYQRIRPLMVDPVWAAVLEGHILQVAYMQGHTRRATARAEELRAEHDDPRVLVRLISSVASGWALRGESEAATAYVAEALPHALALQDVFPLAPAWAMNAQALSLLVAGRLDDARSMTAALAAITAESNHGSVAAGGFLRLYSGRIELAAGHVASAAALLDEVADELQELDLGGLHRWARSLSAEALALLGDLDGARRARRLALDSERHTRVYEGDAARARAWVAAAEGAASTAIDELLEVAALQDLEGQYGLAVHSLNDAIRLGAGPTVLDDLERTLAHVDGHWSVAYAAHLLGRRSGEGDDLLEAAGVYRAMGADLHAAEAAAESARAFTRAGLRAKANAAARARDDALSHTGPVSTPALLDAPERARLTRREREVATLAAQGLSNREIADRLFISLRTAEGHLLRASAKLGVSARSELQEALRGVDDTGERVVTTR